MIEDWASCVVSVVYERRTCGMTGAHYGRWEGGLEYRLASHVLPKLLLEIRIVD